MAVDGTEGWQQLPPKSMEPMPDEDRKYEMNLIYRDPIYIFQNLNQYKIENKGNREYAGMQAIDLYITGLTDFHLYIDPKSYFPIGVSYGGMVPGIPERVEQKEVYSGIKVVDEIKSPLHVLLEAGDDLMKGTAVDIKYNISVNNDWFKGKNIPQDIMDFINLKNRGKSKQPKEKSEENLNETNR
jgi:hypothetical protein